MAVTRQEIGGKLPSNVMQIKNLMTTPAIFVRPETSLHDLAAVMKSREVGALPVMDLGALVGIVTDRDIVIRALGNPDRVISLAREIMTPDPLTCLEDQDVAEAAVIMGDNQIRRLPVLRRDGQVVGVLSLGDIAENFSDGLAGEVVGEVVEGRW